jgi:segregation and condensation protein B
VKVDNVAMNLNRTGLHAMLEGVLTIADEPVSVAELSQVTGAAKSDVKAALDEIASEMRANQRGFQLREVDEGWRLYSSEFGSQAVEKYVKEGHSSRLSQAALETLAVIAYRQPVSRGRIAAVRGVNVDGVVRTLMNRGLVQEGGVEHSTGAVLYTTTQYFLDRLNLDSLEDLPPVADYLPDLAEVEEFDDAPESEQ